MSRSIMVDPAKLDTAATKLTRNQLIMRDYIKLFLQKLKPWELHGRVLIILPT